MVDCATVIAAPAAAMMLADFGADVVKIEQPREGDMLRMLAGISGFETDSNWFWELDGRNKRSIALDLSPSRGSKCSVSSWRAVMCLSLTKFTV